MTSVRCTVFGLDVWADAPPSFLSGARASATGRRLDLTTEQEGVETLGWPAGAQPISDELELDGRVCFRIEAHPEAGYLLSGSDYGAHLLSNDGRRLRCARGNVREDAWQRLLVAQVLPFAAILNGLEVFHASAVAIDGRAVGLVGPSGSGKTSVALELCRLGAGFIADDVLALESDGAVLLGHPGSPVAGLDHAEAERARSDPSSSELVGVNDRELLVRMSAAVEPAPLSALFFLDRRSDGPAEPAFERLAEAQMLLSATFNFVLATPERLRKLLDVCALAAQRRVERVLIGPSVDAAQLAAAVSERLAEDG